MKSTSNIQSLKTDLNTKMGKNRKNSQNLELAYAKQGLPTKNYKISNTGNKVYDNLKNSATRTYNKSVDQSREANKQFYSEGKYYSYGNNAKTAKNVVGSMGKQIASNYNSAKSKVQNTIAEGYKKASESPAFKTSMLGAYASTMTNGNNANNVRKTNKTNSKNIKKFNNSQNKPGNVIKTTTSGKKTSTTGSKVSNTPKTSKDYIEYINTSTDKHTSTKTPVKTTTKNKGK